MSGEKIGGRMGHRLLRVMNSILVFGGRDEQGNYVNKITRINCETLNIDHLVIENELSIENFVIFCNADGVYLWGGIKLGQVSITKFRFKTNYIYLMGLVLVYRLNRVLFLAFVLMLLLQCLEENI